jgi:hypothetical protein
MVGEVIGRLAAAAGATVAATALALAAAPHGAAAAPVAATPPVAARAAGAPAAVPVAAGPVAAGPVAAGPVAAGPVAAGPVAAGPVAAAPGGVARSTKAARPDGIRVTGTQLAEPIAVTAARQPHLFVNLLNEVNWLKTAVPLAMSPAKKKLGAKYTLVVLAGSAPQQTYDLYPQAIGGPRAFRPAQQPWGKTTAGWFYGRLSMSETLRISGAPLPARVDVYTGGIGGGSVLDTVGDTPSDPAGDLSAMLTEMRGLVLLNFAVAVVLAAAIAGMAYLIRHKI